MALRDVIGQERAVTILLKTIRRGRIPSSYLFAGESGIGKKFTAINLAKALNCLNPPSPPRCESIPTFSKGGMGGFDAESTPPLTLPPLALCSKFHYYTGRGGGQGWGGDCCDDCSSCRKIDSGVHPDVLLILPEGGQIRIEEIRAIDDILAFKPFEGRWKVVIVDEADTMNPYAANAFLKTLEEPTKDSLIILISSNPDRLPDTIRSRCSRVNFTPLSHKECKKVIEKVISQEPRVPPTHPSPSPRVVVEFTAQGERGEGKGGGDRVDLLVRLSMGRPGLVLSTDLIEERGRFLKLLQEMLKGEKDGWTSKEEMERWFDLIAIFLREAAIIKITQDEKNLINVDLKDYIMKLSGSMDVKVIVENYQKLNTLRGYLKFNLNKSLTWNYTGSILRRLKTEN